MNRVCRPLEYKGGFWITLDNRGASYFFAPAARFRYCSRCCCVHIIIFEQRSDPSFPTKAIGLRIAARITESYPHPTAVTNREPEEAGSSRRFPPMYNVGCIALVLLETPLVDHGVTHLSILEDAPLIGCGALNFLALCLRTPLACLPGKDRWPHGSLSF